MFYVKPYQGTHYFNDLGKDDRRVKTRTLCLNPRENEITPTHCFEYRTRQICENALISL